MEMCKVYVYIFSISMSRRGDIVFAACVNGSSRRLFVETDSKRDAQNKKKL